MCDGILTKFKLIQALIVVLIVCKNEEDPFKIESIAPIIQLIFERSLATGEVPSDCTKANVSPIFKKGDKSDSANYRPISLTCVLCKVMEHIIASNLTKHLNKHKILYNLQQTEKIM